LLGTHVLRGSYKLLPIPYKSLLLECNPKIG
jgi:hypothetical protein